MGSDTENDLTLTGHLRELTALGNMVTLHGESGTEAAVQFRTPVDRQAAVELACEVARAVLCAAVPHDDYAAACEAAGKAMVKDLSWF